MLASTLWEDLLTSVEVALGVVTCFISALGVLEGSTINVLLVMQVLRVLLVQPTQKA